MTLAALRRTHVSPSQIETALGCLKKWAYSRQRPRTQNRYAAFGDRVHSIREAWLLHGTPPDPATPEGKCALAGLENLPMPGTCLVEWTFAGWSEGVQFVPDPDDTLEAPLPWVRYTGRVDFVRDYVPGLVVGVGDHKTCGDLIRAAEMRAKQAAGADPQHVIYPFVIASVLPDVQFVATQWEYLRRTPPKCEPVHDVIPVETIRRRFHAMHHAIAVHLRSWAGIDPSQFPRNLRHCSAYGGCPYRDECHVGVSVLELAAAQLE